MNGFFQDDRAFSHRIPFMIVDIKPGFIDVCQIVTIYTMCWAHAIASIVQCNDMHKVSLVHEL